MVKENKILIKRYQNRKLYDTRNSMYVTLEDIAKRIKAGEDVQVLDNRTKNDITQVILTQIIFEEGKRNHSLLPLNLLKRIIQDGGGTLREFVEKTIDTGMSSFSKARDEAERVFDKIKDELTPDVDTTIIKDVINRTEDLKKNINERIRTTVENVAHVPTLQNEIRNLRKKITFLEKKLTEK